MPEPAEEIAAIAGLPSGAEGGRVFASPWEAQIFAIVVELNRAGRFAWPEFAQRLAAEIHRPNPEGDDVGYYRHWATAAFRLLLDKGLVPPDGLIERSRAIQHAREHPDHHHVAHPEPIAVSPGRSGREDLAFPARLLD
jgi:nitrile hydratase accessory protein